MKSKPTFKQIIGILIFALLPLTIITFDSQRQSFILFNVAITTVIAFITILLAFHPAKRINYYNQITLVILFVYSFLLFAAYPFTVLSWMSTIGLFLIAFAIPFISLKTAMWFYTMGGSFPLPSKMKWLAIETKTESKLIKNYKRYISKVTNNLVPLIVGITFAVLNIVGSVSTSDTYSKSFLASIIVKILSLILMFGYGLWFGTVLIGKKRKYL